MTRITHAIELEGKPENVWLIHRQLVELLETWKKKADSESVKVSAAWNENQKTGFSVTGLMGKGAKSLWNWWNEPEVEEAGTA